MRVALRFAYDGRFPAYARRPGGGTVEDHLIEALGAEGFEEGTFRSGSRTDAGVAAAENVCAAVVARPLRGLVPALQARLPDGIWMRGAAPVGPAWNPRHAAARTYAYLSIDQGEDLPRLRAAATAFQGRHDMAAFARVEPGRDPVRRVIACQVEAVEGGWELRVTGESFLWNQVRRMAGAVLAVGRGEAAPEDIRRALRTGDRHPRFALAPASGLLLLGVQYKDLAWDDAAGTLGARRLREPWQQAAVLSRLAAALNR